VISKQPRFKDKEYRLLLLWLWLMTERMNMADQQRRRGRNPFSTVLKS